MRVVLSGHFCAILHVGHARSIRPVFDYRITGVEVQIKTKQTNKYWLKKHLSISGFGFVPISGKYDENENLFIHAIYMKKIFAVYHL